MVYNIIVLWDFINVCGFLHHLNSYSLLKVNPKPTRQEIEDNFDGNICRCTGYRPILDAMKSFASDSKGSDEEKDGFIDIEVIWS